MADAQATFAITFDTSSLQANAKAGDSALERQSASIKRVSKDLDALKGAQKRLLGSASVKQYLAQQKAIEATQRKAAGLEKSLSAAQESVAIAKQAKVAPEDMEKLVATVDRYKESLGEATAELKRLEAAQGALADDAAVKAYKDKSTVIGKQESDLADLQAQFDRAGGSAGELATETKGAESGLSALGGAAGALGGPVGGAAAKIESMGGAVKKLAALGPAGLILALAAAVTALVVAAGAAYLALAKMALGAADAARSAGIIKLATTQSVAGVKDLDSTIDALRQNTAASKEEATALATELYKLGLRGKGLEDAALTIERIGVVGEDTKGQIKSLYEQIAKPAMPGQTGMVITADMLPRDQFLQLAQALGRDGQRALLTGFQARKSDVAAALKKIGSTRFGDAAMAQMLSLSKLAERAHENVADIFKGIELGPFLGALKKIVNVFDQSTSSGKALKHIAETALQPLFDAGARIGPIVEAALEGMVFGMLLVELYALKAQAALKDMFPESTMKDVDVIELAFEAVAGAVLATAAVFAVLGGAAMAVIKPIYDGIELAAQATDALGKAFDDLAKIDLYEIGANIVKGLVDGIKSGAGAVADAVIGIGSTAKSAIKGVLGIKSPSRVFRSYGQNTAEGYIQGVEEEGPRVDSAVGSMIAVPAPSPAGGAQGGPFSAAGGGVTIRIEPGAIVINGVKDAEEMQGWPFLDNLAKALATIAAQRGGPPLEPLT